MSNIPEEPFRTEAFPDPEKDVTPIVTVRDVQLEEKFAYRQATLQAGAIYILQLSGIKPYIPSEQLLENFGIRASAVAEIELGQNYNLMLLDRGESSQGVSEPIIPGSQYEVNDRFMMVTPGFMMRAQMRHARKKDMPNMEGMVEFCQAEPLVFGRSYSHDRRLDTSRMPKTVSNKHLGTIVDFEDNLNISDTYSTNLTRVRHGMPSK